ncbi:DNA repair protein RecN [Lamprobacter modestohalophilus]|uniref:DNA repair protein RecN n=1 Tax=Lamprobacter modestohalophilus TaxID=1064514 RepID=UPI002ADECA1D|nr:DNA repair protein RecN [Lamprobacter modestohalophilus]MEA1051786.1 DNA repair protein RecN [Lamprobacter modestohalophilus]
MLTQITVQDLVIVSRLELELAAGMTALTGETGAGKSILIDALGLTLGDKADASLIRSGCERAEISASFDVTNNAPAQAWLAEQALEDDHDCLIRRVLVRSGRARAYINGRAVSSAQLRELGERLVDIHGQHAHQSLLRAAAQRSLLDGYADHQPLTADVAEHYRRYKELDQRWKALNAARSEREERLELLRFQLEELDALELGEHELDALDAEQRRLANQGQLQAMAATLVERLYEGEQSLRDGLGQASADLASLSGIDPSLVETRELIDGATVQIEEAAANLRHYLDGLEMDPSRLGVVEQRIGRIHDVGRKYRVAPEQLIAFTAERHAEVERLQQADQSLDALSAEREQAHSALLERAEALSASRIEAAARLSRTVTAAMQDLGMTGGAFQIEVNTGGQEAIGSQGLDSIAFLVSANPGQPLQPLAKVASGGELSRISLAIQVATAEIGGIPTLVFDEVDVGIGGGVAEIVGRLLRRLGERRQVLCVTHLAQVAAQAHQHLRVKKFAKEAQTFTEISPLDTEQRIDEVARMLGGTEMTTTTRAHAAEMLGLAP